MFNEEEAMFCLELWSAHVYSLLFSIKINLIKMFTPVYSSNQNSARWNSTLIFLINNVNDLYVLYLIFNVW